MKYTKNFHLYRRSKSFNFLNHLFWVRKMKLFFPKRFFYQENDKLFDEQKNDTVVVVSNYYYYCYLFCFGTHSFFSRSVFRILFLFAFCFLFVHWTEHITFSFCHHANVWLKHFVYLHLTYKSQCVRLRVYSWRSYYLREKTAL